MPKLIIVPTPVGNLGDITLRALEALKNADFVIAEDTRVSGNLLRHFEIEKRLVSNHSHNEHKVLEHLVDQIRNSELVCLVSDAGTPVVSDPGYLLARECIRQGIEVESLPGATAFVPALVESGLPADRFTFEGFLPQKKGRKKRLEELSREKRTMVFYESPYRILKALKEFEETFGAERRASVSRELTKKFGETIRGEIRELIAHFEKHPPKGEFVIVVEGFERNKERETEQEDEDE